MRAIFFKEYKLKVTPGGWLCWAALASLLVAFVLLELSLLGRRSMMIDDVIHIPSGYSYLKTHDFRLNEEHPPFIKALSAIGLEHVHPELPLDSEGWSKAEEAGDPDDGTNDFCGDFFHRNADKFEQIIYWGRVPVVLVPVLLAFAVWAFTRSLFGDRTAILSVLFLLGEPNVIANSTFVQDDLAAALAVFCFVLALRWFLQKPALVRAILLGLALAFGLLVKHSLAVLVPITIALLIAHAVWRKFKYKEHFCRFAGFALIILGCCYFVFIAGYAFDISFIDDDEAVFISEWFNLTGGAADSFQTLLVHLPILLPKYYLYGMDMVVNDVRNGRLAFLFGQVSEQGWWYYFPAAFVLKTTIPFLLLTISGITWTVWEVARKRLLNSLYFILPPLIYLGLCMTSHLNIGVRHIIPVFPFFAIMGANAVSTFLNIARPKKWHPSRVLIWLLVASIGLTVIMTFPDYTTYFSPLAGGPTNGWRVLSDSNVETGQDVKSLAAFLKEHGENQIEGLFVGSGYIEYYGVHNCEIPCNRDQDNQADETADDDNTDVNEGQADEPDAQERSTNYIAIGGYYLEEINLTPEQKAIIDPYRSAQPEAEIGNAIFVFRKKRD
ncbi:MAG: glycosyltransferase family 39 protein [Acidobacteriota bacterium]